MKKFALCLMVLVALVVGQTSAQTYIVYRVAGAVTVGQNKQAVKVGDKLSPQAKLSIPYKGSLQLVNEESSERSILKNPGTGTLASMLKDTKNTVGKVTKQYLDYMLAQVVDGGKSVRVEHSDVATVTREMQKTVSGKGGEKSSDDDDFDDFMSEFDDEFEQFKFDVEREFEDFRDSVNYVFAEFMKKGWKEFDPKPAVPKPADEKVKPQVTNPDKQKAPVSTDRFWFRLKREKVVQAPKPKPQPVPIAPIKEEVNVDDDATVSCKLWGTDFTVHFNPKDAFTFKNLSPQTLSDAWVMLSSKKYNRLLRDCMDIRFEKQLGDWAYLLFLQEMSNACVGGGNEAVFLTAYLYCQSGYRMRLSKEDDKLAILFASEHQIYDHDYFSLDGQRFYLFNTKAKRISICNVPYPDEQSLSLVLNAQQKLDYERGGARTFTSVGYDGRYRDPKFTLTVNVNKHLIDFYDKYPSSVINNDYMTRWAMYANTPLEEEVKEQIYPALREYISGASKLEAVNRLLHFVQGFTYEYDDKVWGKDRAFFAEETLFYPSCDCEDRAILLSRFVRDLVGLPVALVHYPGHLAMAVKFSDSDKATGVYYQLDNDKFYVCDPTIMGWGADVGEPMDQFAKEQDVHLILLNNN